MQNCKKFLHLYAILLLLTAFLVGCSSSSELSEEDRGNSKDVSDYSKDLVATNTLRSKTKIDKENLESLTSSLDRFIASTDFSSTVDKDEVMYKVIEYINTPYLWGGTSKRGIDCSAFVQTVMYQALGVSIPRTSLEQSGVGVEVAKNDLEFGDLVFFDTMRKGRVTHVGIYLSDGYFVHSGSKTGVIVASLDNEFYTRTYLKAKRVIGLEEETGSEE